MRIPNRETIERIHNECRGTKRDGHRAVAAWMYNCAESKVSSVWREAAKMFTLALCYGPTPPAAARAPAPWRTKTGALIPLAEMSFAHLQNALALLERRCADLRNELAGRRCTSGCSQCVTDEALRDWDPRDDFSSGVW